MKINNAELLLKVRGCWKAASKTQQFSTYMELKLRHASMLYNYSRRRCKARAKQKQFIKIEMIIKEIIFNSQCLIFQCHNRNFSAECGKREGGVSFLLTYSSFSCMGAYPRGVYLGPRRVGVMCGVLRYCMGWRRTKERAHL